MACRQDLESDPWIRDPFGALDGKVSTVLACKSEAKSDLYGNKNEKANSAFNSNPVWARMGPTHDQQSPFCWSTFWGGYGIWRETEADFSHAGHPDCFNYSWQIFPPLL